MTQEKLEDRMLDFCDSNGMICARTEQPGEIHEFALKFAREQLRLAAEIVQLYGGLQSNMVAAKIRELMD